MSTFRKYETLSPQVDFWTTVRKNNGQPENGLDIRVGIYDADTNTEQVFSMPEIGATGYYKFRWTPVLAQPKNYFATIFQNGGGQSRTIIDTVDIVINNNTFETNEKIDENDGMAI